MTRTIQRTVPRGASTWMVLVFAGALAILAVTAALNFSHVRSFLDVLRRARVRWLVVAALLQLGTYLGEAEVWRTITCRANCPITFRRALALSFAKLFVDQTVPTGGIAGVAFAGSALGRHGVSRRTIAAAIILERATFLAAYAIGLAAAIGIGARTQHFNPVIFATAGFFAACAIAVAAAGIGLAGRSWHTPPWLRRLTPLAGLLRLLRRADPAVVRQPESFLRATGLQLTVIGLDAATMVVVLRSLGSAVPFSGVFVAFMVSSVFRTIGILPGGLGTFEASSMLTLRAAGAPLSIAVSATLVFRGLSYWLPLIPGLWFAREVVKRRHRGRRSAATRSHLRRPLTG